MSPTAAPPPPVDRLPTYADVVAAAARLDGVAHRTPVITSHAVDERAGCQVFLKVEAFQRVGAFKFRGAYNAVAALPDDVRTNGVVTWSSGNHGQAVALAARLLGVGATIVMPSDAPPIKLAATRSHGATVVLYDRYTESREDIGTAIASERGATIVPPFDHPDVIAGQGTVALELLDQVGPLDALLVPIGGGGLAAGCALVLAHTTPDARLVAAEPAPRRAAREALETGGPVVVDVPTTIMDGQQTPYIGHLPTAVLTAAGASAVGVTETDVTAAMHLLAQRCKLVVEPSGAAGLAALLGSTDLEDSGLGGTDRSGRRVGVVLSGGNVDLARFADFVNRHG